MSTIALNAVKPALVDRTNLDAQKTQTIAFREASPELQLKGQPEVDDLLTPSSFSQSQPPIPTWRAILKRLPQESIDQSNESGKLPPNMMVTWNIQNGQYRLAWKTPLFDGRLSGGTDKIPPTHELRQNILGFTLLVPKEYNHWLVRDKSTK